MGQIRALSSEWYDVLCRCFGCLSRILSCRTSRREGFWFNKWIFFNICILVYSRLWFTRLWKSATLIMNWYQCSEDLNFSNGFHLTLRRPLRKNCGWGGFSTFPRWKSRLFFLNRTSLTPHQIFDAHLLVNTDLSPSRFLIGFYIKIIFWVRWFIAYSNEWNWREKERCLFTLTDL